MARYCKGAIVLRWRFRIPVLRKSNAADAMNSEYAAGQKRDRDWLLLRATERTKKNTLRAA
jgi:hypothetical protein